jgi:two-component system LytT family response regulator
MNNPEMKIRCVVVDDELPARQSLCRLIEKNCPNFEVIQTASNAPEAYQVVKESSPDLVFLDIQMPNESGLEFLDRFEDRKFSVVFCTTYHEYAVEALRKRAFDYLLKPVDEQDLIACAKRITQRVLVARGQETPEAIGGRRVELVTSGQRYFVRHADILYIEASGSYSTFYLESGKRITVSKNLKRIEQMLSDPIFQRVHNSFLVRLAAVQSYNHRNGTLHLQNGKEVPIAVRKKEVVRQRLVELMIEVREDPGLPLAAEDPPSFD